MNSAEIDALVTALSLLRRIYTESEINDDAVIYITNDRFPQLYSEILREIGKIERLLASGLTTPAKDVRIKNLEAALGRLINITSDCDGWESFPSVALDEASDALRGTPEAGKPEASLGEQG